MFLIVLVLVWFYVLGCFCSGKVLCSWLFLLWYSFVFLFAPVLAKFNVFDCFMFLVVFVVVKFYVLCCFCLGNFCCFLCLFWFS